MAEIPKDEITVILDPAIHRVIRMGQNLSNKAGVSVVLSNESGVDIMSISNGNGIKKIKCSGTHVPPDTGHHIGSIMPGTLQKDCSLFKDFHRVILLGKNISGDSNFKLSMTDLAGPGAAAHENVLTLKSAGESTEIPADGSGTKIPPNTGD